MRKITQLFILLFISLSTLAQRQVKIYFDKEWNVIKEESSASYYRIITYNKDNKSGIAKDYFKNGKIQYIGKFLSTDLTNPNNDIKEGECVWYHENGTKEQISKFINGKEINIRIYFNEDGQITSTFPIINGIPDKDNSLIYIYSHNSYSTFKGEILNDSLYTGEFTIYYNDGDTIIRYLKNSLLDIPSWLSIKPFQKDKQKYTEFFDTFKKSETSSNYQFNTDAKGKVEFKNQQLHISFNTFNFIRSVNLTETPISLNNNDFFISTEIAKESNASIQGIEFGKADSDNLHRISLINVSDKTYLLVYERIVDGNFVEEKTIKEITYRKGFDNILSLKKTGNTITMSLNGSLAYTVDNVIMYGNYIALHGGASENQTNAIFNKIKVKIETIKNIPSQINVKQEGGVFLLPVELNGVLKIDFIFDSGASDVSITPDIALTLIKAGTIKESDWLQGTYYKFADGSTAKSKRFKLRTLKIGEKIVKNVSCSISNSLDAPMLLGQSVLTKFGKYTFDNVTQKLILE